MHKWTQKDFWKKGASEILSFIVLAPVMLILFALLASIVQSESLKEKLEYTTYVAARAAALSESLPAAQANAEQAAKVDLASYGADYDPTNKFMYSLMWQKKRLKCGFPFLRLQSTKIY